MYTNYIFDIYGTLIDIQTDESMPELWDKLAAFYRLKVANYTPEALQAAYLDKVQRTRRTITHTAYPDFPLEPLFNALYTDKDIFVGADTVTDTTQLFRVLSTKYIKLYDGVIAFLEALKAKDKRLYVLSNAQRVFTYYEMQMLGITQYFDAIYFSADYKVCKPDAIFYNILLEEQHLDPKESIMIGNDFKCDIEGAHHVGLDTLYMHSNLSPDIEGTLLATHRIMHCDVTQMAPLRLK